MSLEQIIILISGAFFISFIAWYFFGKKEKAVESTDNEVNILVDGGYSPSSIVVRKNHPVNLKILRTDPSDCLDQIIIPDWEIAKALPLNKETVIKFKPTEIGEFPFHCGMNMFHGKIIVK